MSFPRLSQRIADAALSVPVALTFAAGLREIVAEGPDEQPTKLKLIERLLGGALPDVTPAPFEALWPHAELFLTACIYVAVTDGQYGVEEARHVSALAHRLGLSARQLERLEARVFAELKVRGSRSVVDADTEPGGPGLAAQRTPVLLGPDGPTEG